MENLNPAAPSFDPQRAGAWQQSKPAPPPSAPFVLEQSDAAVAKALGLPLTAEGLATAQALQALQAFTERLIADHGPTGHLVNTYA